MPARHWTVFWKNTPPKHHKTPARSPVLPSSLTQQSPSHGVENAQTRAYAKRVGGAFRTLTPQAKSEPIPLDTAA